MSESTEPILIFCVGTTAVGKSHLAADLASAWPLSDVYVHNPANDKKLKMYSHIDLDNPPKSYDGKLFVLDEADLLCSPQKFFKPWVKEVILRGRHVNCATIVCTVAPQLVHRCMRTLWTDAYLFQLHGEREVKHCVSIWGPECWRLPSLEPRKFLDFHRKF